MMIKPISLVSVLFIVFLFANCASEKNSSERQENNYLDLFTEKWDKEEGDFIFTLNSEKKLALCVYSKKESPNSKEYSVYDIKSNKEIYNSGFIGSEIVWLNENEVVIKGTSRVKPDTSTIINVITGESRTGSKLQSETKK